MKINSLVNLVIGEVLQAQVLGQIFRVSSLLQHLLTSFAQVYHFLFPLKLHLERFNICLDLKVGCLLKLGSCPILSVHMSGLYLVEWFLLLFLFRPLDDVFKVYG